MSRSCPWCREPLSFGQRRAGVCPHCERSLVNDGTELRPIDLRYQEVEEAQWKSYQQMLMFGSGTAVVLFLLLPLLHVTISTALVVPLILLAHMLALRIMLIRQARSLLGKTRRLFQRWITRLLIIWIGTIGYGLTAIPVIGVIPGVVTFAGLTTLVHHYTLWSLKRERQRLPLAQWEKLTLVGLVLLTIILIVVLATVAALVGWSIARLFEMVSGG